MCRMMCFFFQAEDGIRDLTVTGVQTCALPISFFVRRGGYPRSDFFEGAPRWRWPAFASWIPGTALYFVIVWFALPIGATLPSFALAAGLHVVFSKIEQGFARSSPIVSGGEP